MNLSLIETDGHIYLECLPDGWKLSSEQAALDLIAACGEAGAMQGSKERSSANGLHSRAHLSRWAPLLLHAETLPEAFFNLRTGLAGAVLQKFANYHIRCAALIPSDRIGDGHFKEMVLEANRGSQFRVFQDRSLAEGWLLE